MNAKPRLAPLRDSSACFFWFENIFFRINTNKTSCFRLGSSIEVRRFISENFSNNNNYQQWSAEEKWRNKMESNRLKGTNIHEEISSGHLAQRAHAFRLLSNGAIDHRTNRTFEEKMFAGWRREDRCIGQIFVFLQQLSSRVTILRIVNQNVLKSEVHRRSIRMRGKCTLRNCRQSFGMGRRDNWTPSRGNRGKPVW